MELIWIYGGFVVTCVCVTLAAFSMLLWPL